MARTHFTVGDVEALIPALERIFTDVLQLRAALRSIEDKLERAGVKMSREELLESDDGSDRRAARQGAVPRLLRGAVGRDRARARAGRRGEGHRDRGWSTSRRAAAARRSCCAGGWAKRRSATGTRSSPGTRAAVPSTTTSRARRNRWTRGGRPCRASRHCERPSRRCWGVGAGPGARRRISATRRRAWRGCGQSEFLAGYDMDPAKILGDPVEGEADPDVVVVGGLRFHAMCPHHLLPYRGVAHVAYLPAGKLVGFGRLAELVDCFTKRLTLQERATHQIADALVPAPGRARGRLRDRGGAAVPGAARRETRSVGRGDQRLRRRDARAPGPQDALCSRRRKLGGRAR